MPKIFLHDRIWIPNSSVSSTEELKEEFTKAQYDKRACSKCQYRIDRHSYICDTCPAFKGIVKLWKGRDICGVPHMGIPFGDKKKLPFHIKGEVGDYDIVDKRTKTKFDYKVRFILPLRVNQEQLLTQFMRKKYGLLEAPPRSGKTPLTLAICIALGYRFVVMADQMEFLKQFNDHIHGNLKAGIPKCTNLPELEEKYGKKLYGFPTKEEEFDQFQIMFCTYQSFLERSTKSKNRFKWLKRAAGTVAVDEVHSAAADCFSSVLSSMPATYKFGVSGTMARKDGRQFIIKSVLGPIVARSTIEMMKPLVYVHETGFVAKARYMGPAGWSYAMAALARDKRRNKFILKFVLKDLAAGHNIIIPVVGRAHATALVKLINEAAGSKTAEAFMAGTDRDGILERAKSGKTRVVVGIRRLLQRGLNVPIWSAYYCAMPMANTPNCKQETARVLTPLEGKKAIVRLLYEEGLGASFGCAKHCLKDYISFGFILSQDAETMTNVETLSGGRRSVKTSTRVKQF